jgi:ATP-binding protein involved in chromosome partitioning
VSSPAKHTIAVASGKGGVGKSTVALNLALALRERGRVGILDADFYGPNVPAMVNVRQTRDLSRWTIWHGGATRIEPVERHGLLLASAGFLLGERQAFPATADTLRFVVQQLLTGVEWGELDYLLLDLPPGTADLQEHVFRSVPLDGVVVVVTPQYVAHLDAQRLVGQIRDAGVRILGAVENMSGLTCPHCGEHVEVFPHAPEERSLWSDGVPLLARIPLDPVAAASGERGEPVDAFRALAERVAAAL